MNRPLLSICIPTYNFGEFIGQALDSICLQTTSFNDEIEIIILDGGSTDNTIDIVRKKNKQFPFLKYYRQEFRGGIDRDIEKLINLAKGEYCWLFSADDVMLPNAIDFVISQISSGYDIYLCEHDLCTNDMQFKKDYPMFYGIQHERIFHFTDPSEKKTYFKSARTSEAFFSFLATPIFKKNLWEKYIPPESFYQTHWIVAGHLLQSFLGNTTVKYTNKKLIHRREGNDSFSHGDIVCLHSIFIDSFQHVGKHIFGENSYEMTHILRVLRNDVKFRGLLLAKLAIYNKASKHSISDLNRLAFSLYKPDKFLMGKIRFASYKIFHPFFINIIYFLYKNIKENRKI